MNARPVTVIVTSSDGVEFAVATQAAAIVYEETFAAARTAAELEAHGDFVRVDSATAMTDAAPQAHGFDCKCNGCRDPWVAPQAQTYVEALGRAEARWGAAGFVWGDA